MDLDLESDPQRKKVIVVGDSTVGKTSLIFRAAYPDKDLPSFYPTVLRTEVLQQIGGKCDTTDLMIWDTAGQEDYDRLRPLCYSGTDIVLLLCSRSSLISLLNVK